MSPKSEGKSRHLNPKCPPQAAPTTPKTCVPLRPQVRGPPTLLLTSLTQLTASYILTTGEAFVNDPATAFAHLFLQLTVSLLHVLIPPRCYGLTNVPCKIQTEVLTLSTLE